MKKIGFCINSLEMGGAEKLLVDIIKLLHETNKYEIYLLTKYKSKSYFYERIKNIVKYEYLEEKETKNKNLFYKLKSSLKRQKNFNKFYNKIDIIVDFLDGDFNKYLKNKKDKEKIIWLHLDYEHLVINKKINKKMDNYNKVIVITEAMKKMVKEIYPQKDIRKIYNYLDFQYIDEKLLETIEDERLKEEYLLTVCRLDEKQKDVETLLRAFENYKGSEKLFIIGEGKDRNNLEILKKKLKLCDRVEFLGEKNNPYIYMKNAKAFILSTKYEGFGLVLAEALYCGTKVISSDCNYGPREILENGEIGELFSVKNQEELLWSIEKSLENNYDNEKIKKSLERFSKTKLLKEIEEILG